MVSRLRLGPILAAAAVVVALPRYLIAQRFADGQAAPSGSEWLTLVDASAVAWACLEALTLAYIARARSLAAGDARQALTNWSWAVVVAVSIVAAPVIVAVGSHQTLTDLLVAASISHWAWASILTASYGLVVMGAFAADSAFDAHASRIDALVDALDARQEMSSVPAAAAQASMTVNVGQTTQPALQASAGQSDRGHVAIAGHSEVETGVSALLVDGVRSSPEIARALGISASAVRMSDAWRNRVKEVSA